MKFFETIDHALNLEPTRTLGSYLWYRAYVSLTPSTCFVLDDGTGRAVGYCIGTADTTSFSQEWRETFAPAVASTAVPRPEDEVDDELMERDDVKDLCRKFHHAECSALQSWPAILQQYPAHLHIDILPEYQGRGYGTMLINAFFEAVRSLGAKGVHVGVGQDNVMGRAFYKKIGFQACEPVPGNEAIGEIEADELATILLKSL